jgi:photosystem II stability/assembly factor-like uncharacterized protein
VRTRVVVFVSPGALFALVLAGCQSALLGATRVASTSPDGSIYTSQDSPARSLAVDASDGSLIEARAGLWRSGDQGQSWQPLSLPARLHPGQLDQVATTRAAPSSVFAAGSGAGIVRSDDRGQTWSAISSGLPSQEVAAFAVHSFRPDTVYAWISGQGVFRTEDGGQQWQKMDEGPRGPLLALAHSTLEGSMNTGWLYAATPTGPYLSMDCF